jgi:hypothetical protein
MRNHPFRTVEKLIGLQAIKAQIPSHCILYRPLTGYTYFFLSKTPFSISVPILTAWEEVSKQSLTQRKIRTCPLWL